MLVNGDKGRTGNVFSKHEHGDVMAAVEFMVPRGSNSGIYFQGRYEIQILDSHGKANLTHGDNGGIYQRWANGKGFGGAAPMMNASKLPGEWQKFIVTFRAPRFDKSGKKIENARFVKVIHNGRLIHHNVEVTGPTRSAGFNDEKPTGPVMLQGDHGPGGHSQNCFETDQAGLNRLAKINHHPLPWKPSPHPPPSGASSSTLARG